jgi:hypothetical protein
MGGSVVRDGHRPARRVMAVVHVWRDNRNACGEERDDHGQSDPRSVDAKAAEH